MARKVHGSRALLNLPGHHSTAAIVAEIENSVGWTAGKGRAGADLSRYNATPEVTLTITDCDNKVNIEIDLDSQNGIDNSLHKIDTMIDALKKFRKGVVVEGERTTKRIKRIPAEHRYGL